jgi:hypothetical protein
VKGIKNRRLALTPTVPLEPLNVTFNERDCERIGTFLRAFE